MSFFTPEEDLETYNQLDEYSHIAEDLELETSNNEEISIKQKQDILFPIIDEIKNFAAIIIEEYILFLKNKNDQELFNKLTSDIDQIIEKIDYFKNKIYDIYKTNNKMEKDE